eukprot:gene26587-33188_t
MRRTRGDGLPEAEAGEGHQAAECHKRSQELSNSASYTSMLRNEGRNARKQVLEAAGQIREKAKTRSPLAARRYKHELHTKQLQIPEVRRADSKNPHLMRQIGVLESSLKQRSRERLLSTHRAVAVDELASTYSVRVLALYADGASYGSAQFGWQANGLLQDFNSKDVHLIGLSWIEREIDTVRHGCEDEVRLLDAEVGELRGKLSQSNSWPLQLWPGAYQQEKLQCQPDHMPRGAKQILAVCASISSLRYRTLSVRDDVRCSDRWSIPLIGLGGPKRPLSSDST